MDELPNTIEGMSQSRMILRTMYTNTMPANYRVVGTYSAKEYRLGQKMRVQVVRADKNLRTIDFCRKIWKRGKKMSKESIRLLPIIKKRGMIILLKKNTKPGSNCMERK